MDGIMVCVKQVPNTTNIKLDPKTHTLIREGVSSILNPFDEYALDAALDCKDKYGARVGVVSMGPVQATKILRRCLEKGADEVYLLTDKRLAGSDTLVTAKALHALIQKTPYKNIFCGQETIDSSTGHIGPSLAELFSLPQAAYVSKIIDVKERTISVRIDFDVVSHIMEVQLPAVLTFKKTKKKMRPVAGNASEKDVKVMGLDEIGLDEKVVGLEGSPTFVVDIQIDEDALNYLIVDNNLSAFDRIKFILSGGVEENKNRIMLKDSSESTIDTLLGVLKPGLGKKY